MNFEVKHQYFKDLVKQTKNLKTVTPLLAERRQMTLVHALA